MLATRLPVRAAALLIALLFVVAGCTHPASPAASSGSEASILPGDSGASTPGLVIVHGAVSAGPVCPVERDPPDPSCAARPVAGAVLVVLDAAGGEVARVTSGADGQFEVELGPGSYRLVPQPREGLMGTAAPVTFQIKAGEFPAPLAVSYDTGIR